MQEVSIRRTGSQEQQSGSPSGQISRARVSLRSFPLRDGRVDSFVNDQLLDPENVFPYPKPDLREPSGLVHKCTVRRARFARNTVKDPRIRL